jgi:glutathione synthase/RimK-type ligase-like ATP-grasp enzyme
MAVLIVTHSADNESIALVTRALEQRGERAYRLDTDRYPTEVRLSLTCEDDAGPGREERGEPLGWIDGPAGRLPLAEVTAVWYRRSSIGAGIPADLDPQLRRPSVEESRRMVFGMLAALEVPIVDRIDAIRRAEHKPLQLRLARRLGLDVPRTLSTNDPEAVRAFARGVPGGIVAKMMSSFAVYEDGVENVVFTNAVSDADLADLDGLELCPMTFQERIDKALELRVTVVGRQIFAASIDSQASPRARHDWRRDGAALAAGWKRYELPAEVAARTLALMDRLDLAYGACDFIVTPDGRHVFLEVNPSGEFMWLVTSAGLPIDEALADVLAGRASRR